MTGAMNPTKDTNSDWCDGQSYEQTQPHRDQDHSELKCVIYSIRDLQLQDQYFVFMGPLYF